MLQIYRDSLNPGREGDFTAIEEDAARICADLKCPNAHLAMQSLSGPTEVWWLTPYESQADKERVADGYARNAALSAALAGISKRKHGVVGAPMDVLAAHNPDSSRGSWKIAGARFFVVMLTEGDPHVDAVAFDAPDGTRFLFRATG